MPQTQTLRSDPAACQQPENETADDIYLTATLDQLRATGYAVVEGLLDLPAIDDVRTELEPWFANTPRCEGDFYGWQTTRIASVLFKSAASHRLLVNRFVLALMDRVLGPACDWYQLNLAQAIRLHPGERQQFPHRDDDMWPCAKLGQEYMVNVMWALSDFTVANGATLLWPRSQHASTGNDKASSEPISAVMSRGSALIYMGSVQHCGGANRTDQPRTGLVFSYSLGWLKQYENAFLAYPPTIARSFSKQVQQLLGYRLHQPNLGNYEGQDPSVIFETDSRTLPTVDGLPGHIADQLRGFYAQQNECSHT